MHYGLLGPIQVIGDDGPLEINGTLRRTLLASLLLNPNRVVSAEHLAELLWGARPRVSATSSLYNQVMRLRQALGPHAARIRAVPPGYVIDVEPGELDTAAFAEHRAAAAQAAQTGDWTDSSRLYAAALALWRGEPLADVPALHSAAAIQQLCEERILATQGRIDADLHLRRHGQVIGELRTLIQAYPWREAFHGQLMLALYRAGRRAEALDVYRDLRRAIADEFGIEPGDDVRGLQHRILRSDPTLTPPPVVDTPSAAATRVPTHQLPADTRTFTGRDAELDALIAASRQTNALGGGTTAPTVVISAINGMGGVGKTALAVRVAHRLAEQYPDGQLFIDLHGHSVDLQPTSPQDALDYLLRSLCVEPKAIPQELQERAACYRSRLAGTKTLILLDNARDSAQIKPLIPAEPDCFVIVTGRSELAALDDAEFLSLDPLAPGEAVALLAGAGGPAPIDEDDPAAAALIAWCGGLPLAIRIVGARLRHRPRLSPETLLADLRSDGDPFALLKEDDRDLGRVFASSLLTLPEPERRLFTRLGFVPGPDFDALAAAALQDTDVAEAERQLDSLLDHNLLIQHKEGRYRLHDLLRTYARVLAAEADEIDQQSARDRLSAYYVETAASARGLWDGGRPGLRQVSRGAHGLEDADDARAWLDAEIENLFAIFDDEALDSKQKLTLAGHLQPYLRTAGPWDRASKLLLDAVGLARNLGDTDEEARALTNLGIDYSEHGMAQDAARCLNRAVTIYRELGNRTSEAYALQRLSWVFMSIESFRAFDYARQALEILRGTNSGVEANLLHTLSVLANLNGRFDEAVEYAEALLQHGYETGNDSRQGEAFFNLSHAFYSLRRFDEIEPALVNALQCFQSMPRERASVTQELGRLRMLRGQFDEATAYLEKALKVFTEMGFALGMGYAYGELGRIQFRLGHPEAAMAKLEIALNISLDSRLTYPESFIRTAMAYVHIARGEFAAAEGHLHTSLDISRHGGYTNCQVEAQVGLCALTHVRDGSAAALPDYCEALEFARRVRHPHEEAVALVGLGRCELETGDVDSGIEHLHQAIELYERMGSAFDVAETRTHLPPGR